VVVGAGAGVPAGGVACWAIEGLAVPIAKAESAHATKYRVLGIFISPRIGTLIGSVPYPRMLLERTVVKHQKLRIDAT
jgi:hypothetical protein